MSAEDRIERARLLYERAVYGGDASALETADRELDAVEADLALARGRVRGDIAPGNRDMMLPKADFKGVSCALHCEFCQGWLLPILSR